MAMPKRDEMLNARGVVEHYGDGPRGTVVK